MTTLFFVRQKIVEDSPSVLKIPCDDAFLRASENIFFGAFAESEPTKILQQQHKQTLMNRYSNRDAYTTNKRFRQRHTAIAAETTSVTNSAAKDTADAAATASRSCQRRFSNGRRQQHNRRECCSSAFVRPLTTFLQQTPLHQGNRRWDLRRR